MKRTIGIIGSLVFLYLSFIVGSGSNLSWDAPLILAVHNLLSCRFLDTFFLIITHSALYYVFIPITALMFYLWKQGEGVLVFEPAAAILLFPSAAAVVKQFIRRPRPDIIPPLMIEHSFSFPSGHTITAVGVYGLAMVLLWKKGKRGWAVFSGIWMLLVSLSRIYLGVHYPSDVLASLSLGAVLLILLTSLFDHFLILQKEKKNDRNH